MFYQAFILQDLHLIWCSVIYLIYFHSRQPPTFTLCFEPNLATSNNPSFEHKPLCHLEHIATVFVVPLQKDIVKSISRLINLLINIDTYTYKQTLMGG